MHRLSKLVHLVRCKFAEFTGRQFTLVFDDGYDRKLVFKDRKTISFGVEGEEKDFSYDCLKRNQRGRRANVNLQ